ncbi:MAG: nitrite reductase large subunit NirB, partial [Acidimicrobiales bacterium]
MELEFPGGRRTLVVVGNGMVGHKLVEILVDRGATAEWDIVTFCEEPRPAYDRVGLSAFFAGTSPDELSLVAPGFYEQAGLRIHLGDRAVAIERDKQVVVSANGVRIPYDAVVLATGSYPFVPPVPGHDAQGVFVYRTIEDVEAIREYAKQRRVGAVVGGGLLGLEAANALVSLSLETHVVEFLPRLMGMQVDDAGGAALRRRIEELDVNVHTSSAVTEVVVDGDGAATGLRFKEGDDLAADMVVFSAGIRPRDELARAAGLEMGERGGIVVDASCRTSDPSIYAIGECAVAEGRIWGLVSPGYQMARVVADRILGGDAVFAGADLSTKLKLLGIDVASFGDAFGTTPGSESITYVDEVASIYKKLVVGPPQKRSGRRTVVGGILVGDASTYQTLVQMARGDMPTPEHPEHLIFPAPNGNGNGADAAATGVASLGAQAMVCSCNNVTKGDICGVIAEGSTDVGAIKACTKAGTGCGGCVPLVTEILKDELRQAGVEVRNDLCEHFAYSRQELFDLVRVQRLATFSEVVSRHGTG